MINKLNLGLREKRYHLQFDDSNDPIIQDKRTGKWIARVASKSPQVKTMSSKAQFKTREEAEQFLEKYHKENT